MSKIEEVKTKLTDEIDNICGRADKNGRATWSIADTWDGDFWAHRHAMVNAIRERGYKVESSVNWGVVDYVISKEIKLT